MKKVLTVRYLLQGYRFARAIDDFEMLEDHFFGIMAILKSKPKIYKRFIFWRMRKDSSSLLSYKLKRLVFNSKMLSDRQ